MDHDDVTRFIDNMAERPARSESWTMVEVTGPVAPDATRICFGVIQSSRGTVWYDDLELAVGTKDGGWQRIAIANGDFETPELRGWQPGVGGTDKPRTAGWLVTLDHESDATGGTSLRIEHERRVLHDDLFPQVPDAGETVDIDLGSGLRARVPIALYSKHGRTLDDPLNTPPSTAQMNEPRPEREIDVLSNAADIIVYWNIFEHFWPYWNTVSMNWSAALDPALSASLGDRRVRDHLATLERLSANAPDGHVSLSCPGDDPRGYVPFSIDLVESQAVVTTSTDRALERGDVVLAVDGRPVTELLASERALVTGSAQWKTVRALKRLGVGARGSTAALQVRRRGRELRLLVQRVDHEVSEAPLHEAITRFTDGVYYIDLARADMPALDEIMADLAAAPGVVFDYRHRPKANYEIMWHIAARREPPKGWELVPHITRPDSGSRPQAWEDTSTWNMTPMGDKEPHFSGRVAFLAGPEAISTPETRLALVQYHHMGEIVGAPTAGTNGDVAGIALPTGCRTLFTARRVLNPEGGEQHLVGIQPTIPAARTIAGVAAGRDEVLERALAYVRTGTR